MARSWPLPQLGLAAGIAGFFLFNCLEFRSSCGFGFGVFCLVAEECGDTALLERDSITTDRYLADLASGRHEALGQLLELHRDYVRRVVVARIDPALSARVDPSDVVQETLLQVSQRIEDYLERKPASFRVWLRSTTIERLIDLQRRHRAAKRSIVREIHFSDATSLVIAQGLFQRGGPSQTLQRREIALRVQEILGMLSENDREILVLRKVEGLSNHEAAETLGIEVAAARKRLGRAIMRMTILLKQHGVYFE